MTLPTTMTETPNVLIETLGFGVIFPRDREITLWMSCRTHYGQCA
jgi:hypothetical protein